jgi:hypothetical protein
MAKATAFGSVDLGVVACKHVACGARATTLITHYGDGDWSFSCGQADHSEEVEGNDDFVLVHVGHILDSDPAIEAISDLPKGWSADREGSGKPWRRYPDPA